ncbi:MAG: hypothetical protein QMD50_03075 [Patescibacteria group bacterium]|nr:hypothetical protein [Patescibacteria group bacterium]
MDLPLNKKVNAMVLVIIVFTLFIFMNKVFAVGFREWAVIDNSNQLASADDIDVYQPFGRLYAVGYDSASGTKGQWKLLIRKLNDGKIPDSPAIAQIVKDFGNGNDRAYAVKVDASGIYIGGYRTDTSANRKRDVIAKFSHDGLLLWQKGVAQGHVSTDNLAVTALALDTTGNLYAAGYRVGSLLRYWEIAKFNSSGMDQWRREIKRGDGSTNYVQPNSMVVDSVNVFIAGGGKDSDSQGKWFIEKRNVADGGFVTDFDGDGVLILDMQGAPNVAMGIVGFNNNLYIIGTAERPDESGSLRNILKIKKISKTGAIDDNFERFNFNESGKDVFYQIPSKAMAIDATGLYVGGIYKFSDDTGNRGFIEKRDLSNGGIIWRQSDDYYWRNVKGIALDKLTYYPTSTVYAASYYDGGFHIEKTKQETRVGDFIRPIHVSDLRAEIERIGKLAKESFVGSWPSLNEIQPGKVISYRHAKSLRDNFPANTTCSSFGWKTGDISEGQIVRKEHFNEISKYIDELKGYTLINDRFVANNTQVTQCNNWQTLKVGGDGGDVWHIATYSRVTCDGTLEHKLEAWTCQKDPCIPICVIDWINLSGSKDTASCRHWFPHDTSYDIIADMYWNRSGYPCGGTVGLPNGANALCAGGSWSKEYITQHAGSFCSANNFYKP